MSSRTAAGRRRLEVPRPPLSAKNLFFRSKTSKSEAIIDPFTLLQPTNLPVLHLSKDASRSEEQSQYSKVVNTHQFPTGETLTHRHHLPVYRPDLSYTTSTLVSETSYQQHPDTEPAAARYIQASYQPPPPHLSPSHSTTKYTGAKAQKSADNESRFPPSFSLPTPNPIPPQQLWQSTSSITLQHSLSNDHIQDYSGSPTPSATTPQPRPKLQVMTKDFSAYYRSPIHKREFTIYPSPPLTHTHLSVSPLHTAESPIVETRLTQIVLRDDAEHGIRSSASTPSTSSVRSSTPTSQSVRRPRRPSLSSNSSGSSIKSSQEPGAFVFPGSRSSAKPKISKKATSTIAAVSNRSKSRTQTLNPVAENISMTQSSNSCDSSERKASIAQPESISSGRPSGGSQNRTPSPKNDASESTAFIFPSSRSRAQPLRPLISGEKKQKHGGTSQDGESGEKKTRFLGLLGKKKSKPIQSGQSNAESSTSHASPTNPDHEDNGFVMVIERQDHQRTSTSRIKSRKGSYPLDACDPVLLDNDRHTGKLLARLNPTSSPTFYHYGNNPPSSVLDLGCGQGHWVIDAAIAWKGYGTIVTGYDMVDLSEGLIPWAVEQNVSDSIRFVKGNFLKQRLPFSDNSFDLIRMSCLALCVTSESWMFVLQEVCRVLMVGGRLELIDDEIFFPYGEGNPVDHSMSESSINVAPRLGITIPSCSFSTFSIYDSEVTNPGLGALSSDTAEGDTYDISGLEEDTDADDTTTIHGSSCYDTQPGLSKTPQTLSLYEQPRRSVLNGVNIAIQNMVIMGPDYESWKRAHSTSEDVEALFDHMLTHKFGISKNPGNFILGLMKQVFGHAREVRTMRLTLAPPLEKSEVPISPNDPMFTFGYVRPPSSLVAVGSPGLVLEPSTFIPMDPWEIEIHSSKHLRLLLSCKDLLVEHALEATDDDEIDAESVQNALMEYERFLKYRLNPAPPPNEVVESSENSTTRHARTRSVSTENLEDMWDVQSEFRQRFEWSENEIREQSSRSQSLYLESEEDLLGLSLGFPSVPNSPNFPPSPVSTIGASFSSSSSSSDDSAASQIRCTPMPHVRTFRVYEAIKMDEGMVVTSAF